jgi:hypothetical protein
MWRVPVDFNLFWLFVNWAAKFELIWVGSTFSSAAKITPSFDES